MSSDREGIVSLFLFDDKTKQINSDVVIILMQPLLHLGTVQETADEGDTTPPVRSHNTPNFSQCAQATEFTPNFKQK